MHTVYLVPGLGTDERIFRNLKFNCPTKTIKWTVYHLHGDKDTLIPYKNIKNPIRIKGGTHLMVLNKAGEINGILNEILL